MRRRPAAAALVLMGATSLAALLVQRVVSEQQVRAESEAAMTSDANAIP